MKSKLISLLFLILTYSSFGTDQFPDLVLFQGDTFYISETFDEAFPLYPIWESDTFRNKFNYNEKCTSSACSRLYRATWLIENHHIYLKEVKYCCSEKQYDLKTIFDKQWHHEKGVLASWINEPLVMTTIPFNSLTLKEDVLFLEWHIKKGEIQPHQCAEGLTLNLDTKFPHSGIGSYTSTFMVFEKNGLVKRQALFILAYEMTAKHTKENGKINTFNYTCNNSSFPKTFDELRSKLQFGDTLEVIFNKIIVACPTSNKTFIYFENNDQGYKDSFKWTWLIR